MLKLLYKLSIKFLKWDLKRMGAYNIELVIRCDGTTFYKRNREKEKSIKRTLDLITLNESYIPTFKHRYVGGIVKDSNVNYEKLKSLRRDFKRAGYKENVIIEIENTDGAITIEDKIYNLESEMCYWNE